MKLFSQWTIVEVEEKFQVVLQKQSNLLKAWLAVHCSPAAEDEKLLDTLRENLQNHVYDWNEEELKVKFIAPLLCLVNFDQEDYQSFWDREISVIYEGEKLSGALDFVVAQGKRVPKRPYFFIHEYKKELESSNDPLGQLLIAMIAAQKLNGDQRPIYGAYVVGRLWNFIVLEGLDYTVSLAYDATKDELKDIFGILGNTKTIIEALLQKR